MPESSPRDILSSPVHTSPSSWPDRPYWRRLALRGWLSVAFWLSVDGDVSGGVRLWVSVGVRVALGDGVSLLGVLGRSVCVGVRLSVRDGVWLLVTIGLCVSLAVGVPLSVGDGISLLIGLWRLVAVRVQLQLSV
jgi:hypothetical protein